MENIIVQQIENLQAAIKALKLESNPDQEQSKEKSALNKRIDLLKQTLLSVVHKVIDEVEEKTKGHLMPHRIREKKIEILQKKLTKKKKKWTERVEITMSEKADAIKELQEIQDMIKRLQKKPEKLSNLQEVVEFDEDQILKKILDCIVIKSRAEILHEQDCIHMVNGIFSLKANKKIPFEKQFHAPQYSAKFQINRKLYICGGLTHLSKTTKYCAQFSSIDYSGEKTQLRDILKKRCYLSLSGVPSDLLAIGGSNASGALKNCEMYSVGFNKWDKLPKLNCARQAPGSILLDSMKAFCFCGRKSLCIQFNTIECIQLGETKEVWKTLPINSQIAEMSDLAAVSLFDKIFIFGGQRQIQQKHMYSFNEEGELIDKLSSILYIPKGMNQRNFIVHQWIIYTIGFEFKEAIHAFNGKEWKLFKV